jgi:arylsulfatase A-like enzyme
VVFPETIGFGKDAYFDKQGKYLSDRLTDEVLSFIEQNRERPFFVYLADHAVHAPWEPKSALREKYVKKRATLERPGRGDDPDYAATIEAVDENVGRIVDALQRWQLTENTVVIFTSDNGGTSQFTAPLNGSKGQLYEGGIRVPLVMTGPGVKQPGATCQVPVSSVDLYPTLLEMARLPAPQGQVLDGVSLVPTLRGEGKLPRERLFWHFPCYVGKATPSSAMREGQWKLVEFFEDGGHVELYDLEADPNERKDLAKSLPERAQAMHRTLREWQQQTGAAIPRTPNPNYDAKSSRPRGRNPKSPN